MVRSIYHIAFGLHSADSGYKHISHCTCLLQNYEESCISLSDQMEIMRPFHQAAGDSRIFQVVGADNTEAANTDPYSLMFWPEPDT